MTPVTANRRLLPPIQWLELQRQLLLGAIWLIISTCAHGEAKYSEHKSWRVIAQASPTVFTDCTAMTGGDGEDSLEANFDGELLTILYREITVRGHSPYLKSLDELRLTVLLDSPAVHYPLTTEVGIGTDGIPFAMALLLQKDVMSAVSTLHRGQQARVDRQAQPGHWQPIAHFSLSGFAAAMLKSSHWCGFDLPFKPKH